ncbi:MAG: 4-alpha-glucanotransferase [Ruminococcus sp.]|nr:4-alpha-glucanotransferase [Ruminococcus sp.]
MRKSCILMHISSIPSKYGIGKLGKNAYDFVDFLVKSGVKCWQILPLNPTSYGDSPYSSFSAYAGNPYFIDFDILKHQGLLSDEDYQYIEWEKSSDSIDYTMLYNNCFNVLKIAFSKYRKELSKNYDNFIKENAFWLDDYAMYMTLKSLNDGKPWCEWDKKYALRNTNSIKAIKTKFADEIEFYKFVQYKFYEQWFELKKYANDKGIEIIGDIPIYVAYDSADVWSKPELFRLNKDGSPIDVAGCPPDVFSPKGQLWGNPIYNWSVHKKNNYSWWVSRIQHASKIYDIVRIDHFRGFESYYTIPFGSKDAVVGKWCKGPDYELFQTLESKLGKLNIIAEDLGFITPEVQLLLDKTGFPGMKVIQFAFDNPQNQYLPHNYVSSNCIAYTGTHDNDTLKGWVYSQNKKTIKFCKKYLKVKKKKHLVDALIELTWSSVANICVAQIQDFLDVGSEGRMNTPSTLGDNWQFRTKKSDFTNELSEKIYALNEMYNRLELPIEQVEQDATTNNVVSTPINNALKELTDEISAVEVPKDILKNEVLKEDIPNE